MSKPKKVTIPTKPVKTKAYEVFCHQWEESEKGCGTRPDGYSLHLTQEDIRRYVQKICAGRSVDNVPDEYTRVAGEPYRCNVDATVYRQLQSNKKKGGNGIGFGGRAPEPLGGWGTLQGGWRPLSDGGQAQLY